MWYIILSIFEVRGWILSNSISLEGLTHKEEEEGLTQKRKVSVGVILTYKFNIDF